MSTFDIVTAILILARLLVTGVQQRTLRTLTQTAEIQNRRLARLEPQPMSIANEFDSGLAGLGDLLEDLDPHPWMKVGIDPDTYDPKTQTGEGGFEIVFTDIDSEVEAEGPITPAYRIPGQREPMPPHDTDFTNEGR